MAALPLIAALAALIPTASVPQASFVLSKTHGDAIEVMNLTCEPVGGRHPRAPESCAALHPVGGQVSELAKEGVACTLQYDPVKVVATGMWRGETREFTAEFANPCVMLAETGPVFDF
ncbi:SSI family serine proteinase inhibitor [Actinosynnema sp. NPDC023587]|uniref:SSI family serine proteinase inhibitor n=1 Tax=Actinosynnema sp. NPDC023587 TaxID=3154695 RepID=UPI0033CD7A62